MAEENDNSLRRSTFKVKAIRTTIDCETGAKSQVIADLPVGRGWQDGASGFLPYQNMGWVKYETYLAERHAKEVEQKKAEEAKKAESVKAEKKDAK